MSSSNDMICDDLLVLIFERLPPKSIIRFRSLSKYWHSRLATPEFIRNHRLQSPQKVLIKHPHNPNCYNFKDTYTLHSGDRLPLDSASGYLGIPGVELPSTYSLFRSSIVGSCNGILCVLNANDISLWNLSIRRRLIVPDNPSLRLFSTNFTIGFGFDAITEDYNVVTVFYRNEDELDENSAFVYSLKRGTWSAITPPCARFYDVRSRKACLFNGVLHWVVEGYLTAETTDENRSCFILTFDLSSHVFGYILLPLPWTITQLTIINGCLAVVSYDKKHCKSWILLMKEYGKFESWCVLYEPPEFSSPAVSVEVFQPVTNGDTFAYCNEASEVYNLEKRLLTNLAQFAPCCSRFEMEAYVESLELIDNKHAVTCGETVYS